MSVEDILKAWVIYAVGVGLVCLASWMSGLPMDTLVGWVALGMAAGAGAKR